MQHKNLNYISLIGLHIGLAVLIFVIPFLSKIFLLLVFFFGLVYVVKKQNKNNEVLVVCAYIVGSEVFIRATGGALFYEFSKYGVIFFIFVGMCYSGFSKNAIPYWIYLLLLIPGGVLATFVLNSTTEDRKIISFTLSGPVCLGIVSLYTYQRKVPISTVNTILLSIGLPIVSLATYVILFNPSVRDVVTGTDSNTETSGGFGPNQVSTALGLGLFIFVSRIVLQSKNKLLILINFALAAIIAFRGLVTLSRGGILTAIVMILAFIISVYYNSNHKSRVKLKYFVVLIVFAAMGIWSYSALKTNGLIVNRYANKDAAGRVKESRLTGREDVIASELEMFYENPVLGVGVGKSRELRIEETGTKVASHDEVTRLLAEHGSLGIAMLMILLFTPILLFLGNRQNIFIIPFLIFWILTINHAAMRIAAPAFIYGLSLLKVYIKIPTTRTEELAQQ